MAAPHFATLLFKFLLVAVAYPVWKAIEYVRRVRRMEREEPDSFARFYTMDSQFDHELDDNHDGEDMKWDE